MRQITIPEDGWTLYPNRGKGGRSIKGRFVTITPVGNLTISAELTREIPKDKPYLRIEHHDQVRILRLMPSAGAVNGSLKMMMPGKGQGVSARVGTVGGFKDLGLIPKEPVSYEAERWIDGSIIVDLASPFDQAAGATPSPEPMIGDLAQEQEALRSKLPPCPPAPAGPQPAQRRTCETCMHRAASNLCRCLSSPKRDMVVGMANVCNQHVFRHPPAASMPQAKSPRQGSRPRVACPDCGHAIPVSAKGLMPHDTDGMIFTGKSGERDKRCPGSNRKM
ncbi:MAG: hypothetical protein ABFE13_18815 [Phycisphaerales bacterium]